MERTSPTSQRACSTSRMAIRTLKLCLSLSDCVIAAGTFQGFFVPLPFFPLSLHYFLYFRCRILSLGMLHVSQTWHPRVWSTAAGAGCWVQGRATVPGESCGNAAPTGQSRQNRGSVGGCQRPPPPLLSADNLTL